jgi:hypothetical protein
MNKSFDKNSKNLKPSKIKSPKKLKELEGDDTLKVNPLTKVKKKLPKKFFFDDDEEFQYRIKV